MKCICSVHIFSREYLQLIYCTSGSIFKNIFIYLSLYNILYKHKRNKITRCSHLNQYNIIILYRGSKAFILVFLLVGTDLSVQILTGAKFYFSNSVSHLSIRTNKNYHQEYCGIISFGYILCIYIILLVFNYCSTVFCYNAIKLIMSNLIRDRASL